MLRTPPGAVVIGLCSSRLSSAGTFTHYRGQASPRILERALVFSCGIPGSAALSACWGVGASRSWYSRGDFEDILHAGQRVRVVGAAQEAGRKDDGQCAG